MNEITDKKLKILVLHNTLTPYRIPLFQAMSKSPGYEFRFVFAYRIIDMHVRHKFGHQWTFDQDLGIDYGILPSKEIHTRYGTLYFVTNLKMLTQKCDLVVLSDHLNIPELLLFIYTKLKKIPVLRWLETTNNSLEGMSEFKIYLKAYLNRISDSIIVPGSESRDYVLGTTHWEDNLYFCHDTVKNEVFQKARVIPKEELMRNKEKLGLKGIVIGYFGQFIERKGLDVLLKAVSMIKSNKEFSLLFVGDGPLKEELNAMHQSINSYPLSFTGYIKQEDLPSYYALCDMTVLPSFVDIWGMVVNESIATGVPVICSSGVGAKDMIRDGKSGFIFEKGDAKGLTTAIEKMLESEELRNSMTKEADKILEDYTIEKAKEQFLEAINRTYLNAKKKRS